MKNFAPEQWNEVLAVNLSPPFHMIRLCPPAMKAKNRFRIVNMASIYSHFAADDHVDHITTETAILGLARAAAVECARTAVACNAICPATALTPAIDWRSRRELQRDGTTRGQAEDAWLAVRQHYRRYIKDSIYGDLIAFLRGPHAQDTTCASPPNDAAGSRAGSAPTRSARPGPHGLAGVRWREAMPRRSLAPDAACAY